MENDLAALKQRWTVSGSFEDEQAYLSAKAEGGQSRFVILDPDGTQPLWLGVVIRRETGGI